MLVPDMKHVTASLVDAVETSSFTEYRQKKSPVKTLYIMCHEEWVPNGFWPITLLIAVTAKYPWSSVLCPSEFSWKILGLFLMRRTA